MRALRLPKVEERPNVALSVGFVVEIGIQESHVGCDGCTEAIVAIGMGLFVRLCNTSLIRWQ